MLIVDNHGFLISPHTHYGLLFGLSGFSLKDLKFGELLAALILKHLLLNLQSFKTITLLLDLFMGSFRPWNVRKTRVLGLVDPRGKLALC